MRESLSVALIHCQPRSFVFVISIYAKRVYAFSWHIFHSFRFQGWWIRWPLVMSKPRFTQVLTGEYNWSEKEMLRPHSAHKVQAQLREHQTERHLQAFFDFINKIILQQKRATTTTTRKNLTLFLGTFPTENNEKRKLRNKNKWKNEHWISFYVLIFVSSSLSRRCDAYGRR